MLVYIIVGLLCVIFCTYVLFYNNPNNSNNYKKLVYYYIKGCKYCNEFMPEWDKIVEYGQIECVKIDCDVYPNICIEQNVTEFPTLHLVDKNNIVKYEGAFKKEEIMEFIKSN